MNVNDQEQQVRDWYQASKQEKPSVELDSAVLAMAKAQLSAQTADKVPQSNWRRYQWPFSIAASVMLVSVLYFANIQQFEADLTSQESAPMASTPSIQSADHQEIQPDAELAEVKPKLVAAKRKVAAVTAGQVSDQSNQQQMTQDLAKEQQLQAYRARQVNRAETEPKAAAKPAYQLDDELKAKLDQLLSKVTTKQGQASAQSDLFKALKEIKQANPDWKTPKKYLKLLTEQQQKRLME